jgi:hypothetical protein
MAGDQSLTRINKERIMSKKKTKCAVSADGHCGKIDVTSDAYQVIFLKSPAVILPKIFGGREYITLQNDGPGEMQVWIDTLPSESVQLFQGLAGPPVRRSRPVMDPAASNIPPSHILQPGQSSTVAVISNVLVRAVENETKGCYVLSWCCPKGVDLQVITLSLHPWLENVIAPLEEHQPRE